MVQVALIPYKHCLIDPILAVIELITFSSLDYKSLLDYWWVSWNRQYSSATAKNPIQCICKCIFSCYSKHIPNHQRWNFQSMSATYGECSPASCLLDWALSSSGNSRGFIRIVLRLPKTATFGVCSPASCLLDLALAASGNSRGFIRTVLRLPKTATLGECSPASCLLG